MFGDRLLGKSSSGREKNVVPDEPSRRDFLRNVATGVAGAAILGKAAFHSENAEAAERNTERTLEELKKPRIDHEISVDDILAIEARVGFAIKAVSIVLGNHVSTEKVRLIYGKNGEFAWDWSIQPGGKVPFKHRHESEERVSVEEGTLHCWLEGNHIGVAAPGKDFVIPSGTDHQPFVLKDGKPVRGIVHFEFEASAARVTTLYWNMVNDGIMNKKGQPDFLRMLRGSTNEQEKTYLTNLPEFLQKDAREAVEFFQKVSLGKDHDADSLFEQTPK